MGITGPGNHADLPADGLDSPARPGFVRKSFCALGRAVKLAHSLPRMSFRTSAACAVFFLVAGSQLWLVGHLGSEVPWGDSWGAEGRRLYPAMLTGDRFASVLVQPHNEHRILWTHLLNAALFEAGGQWDPLTQQMSNVVLRAAVASIIAWTLAGSCGWFGAGVAIAFLPVLAWHNVLWAFQSQVSFVLLWGILALWLGACGRPAGKRWWFGVIAGVAAMFSMGPGLLVPVVWASIALLRLWRGAGWRSVVLDLVAASLLFCVAVALRVEITAHASLHAGSFGEAVSAFVTYLAWPHVRVPLAALALNLPLVLGLARALAARTGRLNREAECATALGLWALLIAAAAAYARGGSGEFAAAVPSRYVDMAVLLTLANLWWTIELVRTLSPAQRRVGRWACASWCAFLLSGVLGLSMHEWRGVLRARFLDRDAPVQVLQDFQRGGDGSVFLGRSRLEVPYSNLRVVRDVMADPRLAGYLPPALQAGQKVGRLPRFSRWVRSHVDAVTLLAYMAAVGMWLMVRVGQNRSGSGELSAVADSHALER